MQRDRKQIPLTAEVHSVIPLETEKDKKRRDTRIIIVGVAVVVDNVAFVDAVVEVVDDVALGEVVVVVVADVTIVDAVVYLVMVVAVLLYNWC